MTHLADPVTTPDQEAHDGPALPPPHPVGTPAPAAAGPRPVPVGSVPPPPSAEELANAGLAPAPANGADDHMAPALPEYRPPAPATASTAVPTIPTGAAPTPPVPSPSPGGTLTALPDFTSISPHRKKRSRGLFGRFVRLVFVLGVLGGLGAAGYVYGPDLLDQLRGEEEAVPVADEPDAPLAFPVQTATPIAVRNATFAIDDLDPEGTTRRFEITTDFETGVSHVLIEREGLPTLEVMTFLDDAVVRRVDDDTWYQTPRGQFPVDDRLDRDRWVRQLDELIPEAARHAVTIERSTTAELAGERMRHLVVSVDPALLAGPELASDLFADPVVSDVAPAAGIEAADPVPVAPGRDAVPNDATDDADLGEVATERTPGAATEPAPGPAGATTEDEPVASAPVPPTATTATPVRLELWIDARGAIRQLITPDELGGERLTVTMISPDSWIPEFPAPEQIEPITAAAIVKLGL